MELLHEYLAGRTLSHLFCALVVLVFSTFACASCAQSICCCWLLLYVCSPKSKHHLHAHADARGAPHATCLSCVLLQFISTLVGGQSLWAVLAIFCGLVLVGTTFISHTVGAMVILPIVQSVGDKMPGDHSKLLVMGAALMCSGGMRPFHQLLIVIVLMSHESCDTTGLDGY
jgi:hypothetical protein